MTTDFNEVAGMGSTGVRRLQDLSRAPAELDAASIRAAARQVPGGVALLSWGSGPDRSAMTALSVSLLSADPAALLIGLRRGSRGYASFVRSPRFVVNMLGADQREIADHFAAGADEPAAASFEVGRWSAFADDLPILADCAAVFECEIEDRIERAETAVVIARVRRGAVGGGSGALVRWRGVYDQLGWSPDEIARAVGLKPKSDAARDRA
jgi:flavin reductase (DIM6/NTAB) family NADH-FMN oxidoreductase RutF